MFVEFKAQISQNTEKYVKQNTLNEIQTLFMLLKFITLRQKNEVKMLIKAVMTEKDFLLSFEPFC